MSFTSEVREELCDLKIEKSLARAEFAGFLKFKGMLEIGKDTHFELSVKNVCAARRVKNLLRMMEEKSVNVFYHEEKKLKRGRIFLFRIKVKDATNFMKELHLNTLGEVQKDLFEDPTVFGAFLRGAFISSGSVVDPARHHHLELYHNKVEILKKIMEKLEEFFGIFGHIAHVKYGYRFYIKNGEMIEEFLNFIGAVKSAKKVHNIMMESRIRSDVTRSLNFIEANSKRSGSAALKHIRAIIEVDKELGLDSLEPQLREIARARLENPELSLRELGNLFTPPLSKSMVHRRLKKILDISEKRRVKK
ncbi:DNA-binding protein WhiA [Mesoaciditoga lauensis]|uniref:DNA-binding protein WhiA n=1 Tax=Mesoaciditoga lauensis TaxID=1495039 RepID=UPI00056985C5|nr:DNA-binding protein WhiA [Mesoaciditoga lauensis]